MLGAALARRPDTEQLTAAYGVFRTEARQLQPTTVNADGWHATRAAWSQLFPWRC